MTTYTEQAHYDIERAKHGLIAIEYAGDQQGRHCRHHCYRFFSYDNDDPEQIWEHYHRTYNPQEPSEKQAIDALNTWIQSQDNDAL